MGTLSESGSPIRVAVIGVGYLGAIHAKIYDRLETATLVGVCDTNPEASAKIASQYGCEAWTNPRDAIGKIDAVSIVVPTSLHADVAQPFLDAGIHMLLEKPVASSVPDAEKIVSLSQRSGAILQIGHLERFNGGVMELARRASNPRFIEAHRLSTFVDRATDVDVVTDLMIHDIDICLTLVNSELENLSAVGSPVVTDHVDIANARLEFANGAVANVTASRVSNKKFRRIRVFGEKSYHALDFTAQKLDIMTTSDKLPDQKFADISTDAIEVESTPPLDAELAHFVDTVRTGGTPLVTGRDGVEALKVAERVVEKIEQSMRRGKSASGSGSPG